MKKVMITILKSVLFFLGWAIVTAFLPLLDTDNQAIWRLWAEITPCLSIVIFTLIFWLIEKRQVALKLFNKPIKGIMIGILGGVFWLGGTVLLLMLFGIMEFDGSNEVPVILIWILAAFINVVMQELLVRGYLYQMLKYRHNILVATIVTTALFTFMHGGAFEAGLIPVLNVVTMSLLMTVILEYTESIIAPIIMHAIWNCVGAIILGGVSLADDYPHLLNMLLSGSDILSGGACKIEGSIIVLVLNVLLISFFFLLSKRRKVEV